MLTHGKSFGLNDSVQRVFGVAFRLAVAGAASIAMANALAQSVVCGQNANQCTANDLTTTAIVIGPNAPATCVAGTLVNVPVQLNATNSGNNTRYDLGVAYAGISGTGPYTYNTTAAACQARTAPVGVGNFTSQDGDAWGDLAANTVASAALNGGNVDLICKPDANGVLSATGLVYWSIQSQNNAATPLPNTPKCAAHTTLAGIQVLGALTIRKVAAGSIEDRFDFEVSPAQNVDPASFSLFDGTSQLVSTQLSTQGITYTITELDHVGWQLASVSCVNGSGANVPVSITPVQGGASISVTMSYAVPQVSCTFNNVLPGAVTLSKQWVNPIANDAVSLQITGGTPSPAIGSSIAGGATSDATTNATPGSSVSLSEIFTTGQSANYVSTLACQSGGQNIALIGSSFLMPEGGAAVACTYTNTRALTALTVNKQISGGPGAVSGVFDFTVDCGTDGSFTAAVTLNGQNSGSAVVNNVPAGASCTVNETGVPAAPNGYNWGASPAAQTVTVVAGTGASVTFVNTLTAFDGSIIVTKNIAGVAAATIVSNLSFPFTVNCSTPTASYSGTVTVTANTLTGTATVTGVPAGSSACTIAEGALPAAPANYAWGAPAYSQPAGVLGAAGTLNGSITNTLTANAGSIVVTKNITGVTAATITSNLTFPFTISCSTPTASYSGSVTVSANSLTGSTTVGGIPAGSSACTLAEGTMPAAPVGYAWGSPQYTAPAGTMAAGGSLSGAIVNPLTQLAIAPPAITKSGVVGPSAGGSAATWTITVGNTAPANAQLGSQPMTMSDPIPVGTNYVAGSLNCTAAGGAAISNCQYDSGNTRVLVNATLPFASSVTVVFATAIAGGAASVPNTATASFDRSAVATQVAATAAVAIAPTQIPTVSTVGMLALFAALLVAGMVAGRRQA